MSRRVGMGSEKSGRDMRPDSVVKKENAALKRENAELTKRVSELERQLEDGQKGEVTEGAEH